LQCVVVERGDMWIVGCTVCVRYGAGVRAGLRVSEREREGKSAQ
jgi:hypothetical protein